MAKVPETWEFGGVEDIEELLRELQIMYNTLAIASNSKPDIYQRSTDGLTTDTFLSNGDININTSTRKVEMLTEHSSSSAVIWTTLS
jgi:hypothetical protein